ncbi:hypothetical protein [Bradyrhizobium sp. RT6a]|uniref:hypothetical protein n=1 Tax=unclassified Bradyrhizobium TaxID=2631580 RepID=UPI003394A53C
MAERNGREVPDYGWIRSARCVFRKDVRRAATGEKNKATYPKRVHVWEDEQCW